jgi:hypothetical protein
LSLVRVLAKNFAMTQKPSFNMLKVRREGVMEVAMCLQATDLIR